MRNLSWTTHTHTHITLHVWKSTTSSSGTVHSRVCVYWCSCTNGVERSLLLTELVVLQWDCGFESSIMVYKLWNKLLWITKKVYIRIHYSFVHVLVLQQGVFKLHISLPNSHTDHLLFKTTNIQPQIISLWTEGWLRWGSVFLLLVNLISILTVVKN